MLCPTMLQYVVLACCDRLAGALLTALDLDYNQIQVKFKVLCFLGSISVLPNLKLCQDKYADDFC